MKAVFAFLVVLLMCCTSSAVLLGGVGRMRACDAECQRVSTSMKQDICYGEGREGCEEFNPIMMATQIVAGKNLFVKVRVGADQFYHIRVFIPPVGEPRLMTVTPGKKETDILEFEQ